jgi:hypothetical protein
MRRGGQFIPTPTTISTTCRYSADRPGSLPVSAESRSSSILMVPQVLEAVLVVLKSAATLGFSMSISGGDLRQCQAALRTRSSLSVKMGNRKEG